MSVTYFVRLSTALFAVAMTGSAVAEPLVISELRVRGPNGANDEFIEIYNQNATPHTVAGAGTGYGVAASDGVTRGTIPNGTVIPGHGHYLIVNSVGYSLASSPAGSGTTATGDATYTNDIPDNAGVALFNNNAGGGSYSLANRMDAIGSTSEANTLYKEGAGYPALTPFSIDYTFHRDGCGKAGSITTFGDCPSSALKDTNNNAADLIFEDTNGTSAGAGQRLGAPGPENLSGPVTNGTGLGEARVDSCTDGITPPNRVRDFTSDPANNSTFGTLDLRHTFTNNTGGSLTRLRFRIVDLTTFPAPSGVADLRPRTSTAVVVTVDRPPCGSGTSNITVGGTTLEQPPSQPNGGGFNSALSVGSVTLGTPLAASASVEVRFLLGIQQTGRFKFALVPEALPQAGFPAGVLMIEGCTDGNCPTVTIDQAAGQADPAASSPVNFSVVFGTTVTGFGGNDVVLGGTAGATTAVVTGGPTNYNVAVTGMTANGTVTATVPAGAAQDSSSLPSLASTSTDNTVTFNGIDVTPPTVTINQAADQDGTTGTSPIHFTVVFSEPVTGFAAGDVTRGGSAGATTTVVSGGPTTYDVAVSGMTANGTVTARVNAGAAIDGAANPSAASTSTDNTVTFNGIDVTPPTVTINQAAGQVDPTGTAPIHFTVVFSEPVTGFNGTDVVLGGTAGATTSVVSGGPTTYDVTVSSMITNGTVIASINAGAAIDGGSNPSAASTSTDRTVTFAGFDLSSPTVTSNRATAQAASTSVSPIHFTVVFSEPVTGFDGTDVELGGTAGATTAVASGGPTTYDVAVSGMTTNGTVTASVNAGAAIDGGSNPSTASTSTDNTVTFDGFDLSAPTVTSDRATAQAASTAASPIHFTVVFSEPVTGFDGDDVVLGGTAGATTAVVTGGPSIFDVAVSGMTTNGTVTASVNAGAAIDGGSNPNTASTSTDSTVTFDSFDLSSPTVTSDRATRQLASTSVSPIHFTVVFSEPVTGFASDDVVLGGTAGATTAVVSGGPITYDVAVSGMTTNGTVSITTSAGAAVDGGQNGSLPSTSTDNTVAFTGIAPAPVCGDGIVQQATEQCDDGNAVDGDGCSACATDDPEPSPDGNCSSSPGGSGFGLLALVVGALLAPSRRSRQRRLARRGAA